MGNISEQDRLAQMHCDASNSISESLHSCLGYGLQTCGTARLDYMGALGQTATNINFGRAAHTFVAGKNASLRAKANKQKTKPKKNQVRL